MKNAIIYCRKSTDRDDKQQNSLESQLSACMRVIDKENLYLVENFIESASAKRSGNRPIFEKMISLCNKWKIQYIIVDEPSRLSRNNTDSARILWLLEEWKIKGIFTNSQKFFGEQASELFILLLNFWMAKLDNDTRAKHIKSRMLTCARKWKCLWKAPFWYDNITKVQNGKIIEKTIGINKKESEVVKEIFFLRWEQKMAVADIIKHCQKKYKNSFSYQFSHSGLDKMLKNPFYIGMMIYKWEMIKWEHLPIISTKLFEKVQNLERGFYTHNKEIERNFIYKWRIFDENNIPLTAEIKKEKYVYYRTQNLRSDSRINISEMKLDMEIIKKLEKMQIPDDFKPLFREIANDIITENTKDKISKQREIESEQIFLQNRQKKLMEWFLSDIISWDDYKKEKKKIDESICILEARKNEIWKNKNYNLGEILEKMFELLKNLSEIYKQGNPKEKTSLLQKLQFELFINNKKELVIKGNKLFSEIHSLDLFDGSATENRTPVYGMKTRCPNH